MQAIILLQQTTDAAGDILSQYGWLGVTFWIIIREILPWLKEQFSASYKARIEREKEERLAEIERKKEFSLVLTKFSEQMQQFGLTLVQVTEKVTEKVTRIEATQNVMHDTLLILADRKQQSFERSNGK